MKGKRGRPPKSAAPRPSLVGPEARATLVDSAMLREIGPCTAAYFVDTPGGLYALSAVCLADRAVRGLEADGLERLPEAHWEVWVSPAHHVTYAPWQVGSPRYTTFGLPALRFSIGECDEAQVAYLLDVLADAWVRGRLRLDDPSRWIQGAVALGLPILTPAP